ncbi:hypothetical protein P2H44_06550 [Albimonas sp. CAU 1670]|uniref:hypothetical protein n=1 Tax=Albimonas sp. CAU 1670 TaxID=3032599 RepID=UPI0023DA87AC|nr:hypothetical protein [Albimonas sp. CAU 1670]MDF2232210.1 hypothetical protein [Albimonas sp. CAU 1670]
MPNFAIFRYTMSNSEGEEIDHSHHLAEFDNIKGKKAPYRVRDPEKNDEKHFVFDISDSKLSGLDYFSFGVGYQITERLERQLNPRTEKISPVYRDANDMRYTRAVFVPAYGVCAFRDGSGDDLSATGGAGRVRAIFEHHGEIAFDYIATANRNDVSKALKKLRLIELTFEVRPFNPHPSVPGDELHKLLSIAKVDKFTGKARPADGGHMVPDSGGLVSEVDGLTQKSYGHLGLKATTSEGAEVVYKKKKLQGDREKDQAAEERPQVLFVSVEKMGSDEAEELQIVRALRELFESDETAADTA